MRRLLISVCLLVAMAVPVAARYNWVVPNRHVVITDHEIKYRAYDSNRKKSISLVLKIDRENEKIAKFEFRVGGRNYVFPKCITELLLSARLSSITITSWYFRNEDYEIAFEAIPEPEDGNGVLRKHVTISVEDGTYVTHTIQMRMSDCTEKTDTRKCEP